MSHQALGEAPNPSNNPNHEGMRRPFGTVPRPPATTWAAPFTPVTSGVIPAVPAPPGAAPQSLLGFDPETMDPNEPDDGFNPLVHSILAYNSAEEIDAIIHTTAFSAYQDYKRDFAASIADLNLQHFTPEEFLFLGGSHANAGSSCHGKNALPARSLWPNIRGLAVALDEIRRRLGAPVRLTSVYRNQAYNDCLPGSATRSQHLNFKAADFQCATGTPDLWSETAKGVRADGFFTGGIGVYSTFVHVDTRGENVAWSGR